MRSSESHFYFDGIVPVSKSLHNRWAVVASFFPELVKLRGSSGCADVQLMQKALAEFPTEKHFDCGAAGSVLRFLALRVSREPGEWTLQGTARLMERPQAGLIKLLQQLGVPARLHERTLKISGKGWQNPAQALQIEQQDSSQFLSALLLSSWQLPFALQIDLQSRERVSASYAKMTLEVLQRAGMQLMREGSQLEIPPQQRAEGQTVELESDMSSAFAVAALATVAGEAQLRCFPFASWQGDEVFVEHLREMGVSVERIGGDLLIRKTTQLKALRKNLNSTPDLLPVLIPLCVLAKGVSEFTGIEHLRAKESDRIAKALELAQAMGAHAVYEQGALKIFGGGDESPRGAFDWNPADDHRWVMAATVAQWAGWQVRIYNPECVAKSYPEFLAWVKS